MADPRPPQAGELRGFPLKVRPQPSKGYIREFRKGHRWLDMEDSDSEKMPQ